MSLSKQLLMLITLIFLIIFSVNFILSTKNIRSYLEGESQVHMQDTATSLGLSLSPHMADEHDPILRTMMNAIFDMGYYKEMRLVDVDGHPLIKLTNPEQIKGVPDWLIHFFPMKTATAQSEISSGWNISGTIYITGNPAYGYLKLYQQFKATLVYSLLILLGAIAVLIVVLRFTLQPLKAIEKQANEISAGNFIQIEKTPWTLEVRTVAHSMNGMSSKIGAMINKMNHKLDTLTDRLKRDPLTRLFNQATFNVNLNQLLSSGSHGNVALIKFDYLTQLTKDKGNKAVDTLLIDFASLLANQCNNDMSAYRLQGSEFALLCPNTTPAQIEVMAKQWQQAITDLAIQYGIEDLLHIGIVPFDRTSEFERVSPAMIEACRQARNIGSNAFFIMADSLSSMTELQWKAAIASAIETKSPEITFTSQAFNYEGKQPKKVMEEAFAVARDEQGKPLSIGTFFAMAQEFDLAQSLDRCIVNKVILMMEQNKYNTPLTINLSMASVESVEFHDWLKSQLEQALIDPSLLAFSVTAYAASKNLNAFAKFSVLIKSFGATILLKRYSSDIIAVDRLKDLHIDYIRLARDLTTNVHGSASKPDFLEIMQEVSALLEIKVLAESVTDDEDFEIVKSAGLYGISR